MKIRELMGKTSADAWFNCSDLLDIDVRGAAYLGYRGQPVIRQNVSGNLELQHLN